MAYNHVVLLRCTFIAALGMGAAPAIASAAPVETASVRQVAVLLVAGDTSDELLAALRVRLPEVELIRAGHGVGAKVGGRALLVLRREGDGRELVLTLEDGRSFVRALAHTPSAQERADAGTLANLIAGIEAGTATHDTVLETLPEELEAPPPKPEPTPEPTPEPEPETADEAELPAPPEVPRDPYDDGYAPHPSDHDRVGLTVAPRLAPIFGLSPEATYRAASAGVWVDYAWPRDGFVLTGIVLAGQRADELTVLQARVRLGGGWVYRSGRFELPLYVAGSVAPWWVRRAGTTVDVSSQTASRAPLLGLGIGAAPGLAFVWRSRGRPGPHMVIAVPIELWASGLAGGPAVARISLSPDSTERQVIGGLELQAGLSIGVRGFSWLGKKSKKP